MLGHAAAEAGAKVDAEAEAKAMIWRKRRTTIPVLRFSGPIGLAVPLRPGLSLATVTGAIEKAFAIKRSPAVAIAINSPGGSPVQSRLIYARVRALAEERKKTVYTFIEDVGASGGYMLALAGDEIWADPTSIVGSIGVISAGFGFHKAIARLDIERRIYRAGAHKVELDPFEPAKPEAVERLKAIQREIHETFKAMVRERRAGRIEGDGEALFDGRVWTGTQACELGLIDGLGDLRTTMRERFGEDVRLKPVGVRRGWLPRRLAGGRLWLRGDRLDDYGGGEPFGFAGDLLGAIEARTLWARYGF